jgi:hypothetical protein
MGQKYINFINSKEFIISILWILIARVVGCFIDKCIPESANHSNIVLLIVEFLILTMLVSILHSKL